MLHTNYHKLLVVCACFTAAAAVNAQLTWSPTGFTYNMVYRAAELNGQLYITKGGNGLQVYDGSTWNTVATGSMEAVVNIDGILYLGAHDFTTNGENDIQTYDGTSVSELQNTDFAYNGSYHITDFAKYNNEIYACGQFMSPGNASANLAKWNGSDWVGVGTNSLNYNGNQNNVANRLITYQNKLYVLAETKLLYYNGSAWDSLPGANGSFKDGAVYNGDLYLCGFVPIYDNNGNYVDGGPICKLSGTTLSVVDSYVGGQFTQVQRMFSDGPYLYAIAQVAAHNNDVYLERFDGTSWTDVAFLQESTDGYVPGYPLPDYNRIFRYGSDLYIGGRFSEINNQPIQSLARVSMPVGIDEHADGKGITAYPNPASDRVTLGGIPVGSTLRVMDVAGKVVYSSASLKSGASISTASFDSGLYSIAVEDHGRTHHLKLLVAR